MSRILLLDIETAPLTAYCWGVWEQDISLDQIIDSSYILCWCAKWLEQRGPSYFASVQTWPARKVLLGIHKLLDDADVVVHYNGQKFDIPVLNKEFIKQGFNPPSPYKQIDLYREMRRSFRFESNKMNAICRDLGLGEKIKHEGFAMWVDCMHGKQEAWQRMEKYNRQDIVLLDKLYGLVRPWIPNHPHSGLLDGKPDACPHCGETGLLQKRGTMVTRSQVYQRFMCMKCGAWCRARKAEKGPAARYV